MLKKVMAFIVMAAMILNAFNVFAANEEKYDYIALGDSITAGYGLARPEVQSYPSLFANAHGISVKNYGVNGKTSEQLLEELKNGAYDLSGAKLVTVSIGSNDIMRPMIVTLAGGLGVDPNSENLDKAIEERVEYLKTHESLVALKKRLDRMEASIINNSRFYALCDTAVKTNIPLIVEEIKKQNSDAQIIVTNFYNPFKNTSLVVPTGNSNAEYAVGNVIQPYIDRLNSGLVANEDYKIADVYSEFTSSSLVNVQIDFRESDVTFDPHPNAKGHRSIYIAVNKVFEPFEAEEDFVYGDANADGQLDASDAADTLQKVLLESFVPVLETKTENWQKYLDVDLSGGVDATDASFIMQKVLKEDFVFPAEKE